MKNEVGTKDKIKNHCFEPMLRLSPVFRDIIWGGTKLRDMYYTDCGKKRIAEAWALAYTPECRNRISGGAFDGLELSEYLSLAGRGILGTKCSGLKDFPLMVKLIDAGEPLSVQVHPGEAYAVSRGDGHGKSEYWYVISSEPGAGVYIGFRDNVTSGEVKKGIEDGSVLELMNFFPTKPGDFFFVPAGTIHSVGGGNLICEVQQNSTCSYRLYDHERLDSSGAPRELQIKKALDVLELGRYYPESSLSGKSTDFECGYFHVSVYSGNNNIELGDKSFYSLLCLKGRGSISLSGMTAGINAGDSIFIPAQRSVLRSQGDMTFILSYL